MQQQHPRPGTWAFICGPSGAGKDSVIDWAHERLAQDGRVVFAVRLVTRAAGPGSRDEAIDAASFGRLQAAGGFAWTWTAHGHAYGIPVHYADDVAAGRVVVVNASREHAAALPATDNLRIALVTAPPEELARRLRARGREPEAQVLTRLARSAALPPVRADLVIDNDGPLPQAGQRLLDWLLRLAAAP